MGCLQGSGIPAVPAVRCFGNGLVFRSRLQRVNRLDGKCCSKESRQADPIDPMLSPDGDSSTAMFGEPRSAHGDVDMPNLRCLSLSLDPVSRCGRPAREGFSERFLETRTQPPAARRAILPGRLC
jgi:hypothetical protein